MIEPDLENQVAVNQKWLGLILIFIVGLYLHSINIGTRAAENLVSQNFDVDGVHCLNLIASDICTLDIKGSSRIGFAAVIGKTVFQNSYMHYIFAFTNLFALIAIYNLSKALFLKERQREKLNLLEIKLDKINRIITKNRFVMYLIVVPIGIVILVLIKNL